MIAEGFPANSGGVVRRAHFVKHGFGGRDIRQALRDGRIRRVRYGWYAHPDAHPGVLAAVRSGAVVSCVSALSHLGVWSPVWLDRAADLVHARRTEHRENHALPVESNVSICRSVERDCRPCPTAIDSAGDAFRSAIACQSAEWLTVLFESAVHRGVLGAADLQRLCGGTRSATGSAFHRCGWLSESGTETLTMLGFRRRAVQFRQQVWIGFKRVDFLIGDRLIVEVDSEEFHHNPAAFEEDRKRDQQFVAWGYTVIRLTYRQVMFEREAALDRVCKAIACGQHRF